MHSNFDGPAHGQARLFCKHPTKKETRMAVTVLKSELAVPPQFFAPEFDCEQLFPGDEEEVLEFLAKRAIHTVYLSTLICDNGLVSLRNRGAFYACRDNAGNLAGVGLI